tara:strand:- start:4511 stop:4675 length:165 start_codon:yes stop_codon:yes gene_type:complete
MNYIEAFIKKFGREPTENEIAILMEAVANQDQDNRKSKRIKFSDNKVKRSEDNS